jgi:ribonuclease III
MGLLQFRDGDLLRQALTHRSYANEQGGGIGHNERLEFLGDAILNFLSGAFLYERFPDWAEGDLTRLRSILVNEVQLAVFGRDLDLGRMVRLGRGAERDGARENANILSSTFEAVVGAYYLDCGDVEMVQSEVVGIFEGAIDRLVGELAVSNPKSDFQHWSLVNFGVSPRYALLGAEGPDHQRRFTVGVFVKDDQYGVGVGGSKQLAEKAAARDALRKVDCHVS